MTIDVSCAWLCLCQVSYSELELSQSTHSCSDSEQFLSEPWENGRALLYTLERNGMKWSRPQVKPWSEAKEPTPRGCVVRGLCYEELRKTNKDNVERVPTSDLPINRSEVILHLNIYPQEKSGVAGYCPEAGVPKWREWRKLSYWNNL